MQGRKKEKVGTAVCKGHVQARNCGIEFICGSTHREYAICILPFHTKEDAFILQCPLMTVMTPPEPSPDAFPDVGSEEDEPVPASSS